ncbi:MAG TPA: DDE-type integrase/transposase/recombinase [Eudoraea sp.]|nr:DDE-type integrase/transposase/recombinase [Eudoraea sp.]
MRLMDSDYSDHPFKGVKGTHTWLNMDKGFKVSQKRIDRLYYCIMGLRAIMPGKHTSRCNNAHKIYPYQLRNMSAQRPNQVWATDITYIPMRKGFMYLTAINDLHSRYVVNWSVSNTMDAQWCKETLEEAIALHGKPIHL